MNRKKAVEYALQTHRLEGFNYTFQEKEMWDKIANCELPLDAAFKDAAAFAAAIPEKRICPETGEEMTRGIKLITLKYEGFLEEVEMPGWYTADKEHGIHNSDDMKVSNAALLRMKAKTVETRICPETGQEMTRGVYPLTLTYKGLSETFEMPGWYTADGEHGLFTSEDTKVSDSVLVRLKTKAMEMEHSEKNESDSI